MSLASQAAAAADPTFAPRVAQAVAAVALTVAAESTGTANHANRVALAANALRFGLEPNRLKAWTAAVAADDATTPAATDSALTARVAALWDAFAGS